MPTTALGAYLRARRALVSPQAAGIAVFGSRRVAGLRREEVATLAGISVDYYVRLEQGRESSPSTQVLDSLGRVLRLDDDARTHLYRVAGLMPAAAGSGAPEQVDPQLRALMGTWAHTPAIVLGRAYDVLAANDLALALFKGFEQGPNLLLTMFLDPDAQTFYRDWDDVARYTVAGFRLLHGRAPDEPRIREIVQTLTARSPEFVRMWERHEARSRRLASKRFHHPDAGDLTLRIHAFEVRSAPDQELIVYQAEAGSPDAEALALLATVAGARAPAQAQAQPRP